MGSGSIRVLHVIPSLSPVHGGPSAALPIMERALTAQGVVVETATTNDDGPGRKDRHAPQTPYAENGVIRWYFAKQTEFYKSSLPFGRWIRRECRRFDLLHIHALFSYTSIVAARTAARAGIPFVLRPLGVLNRYGLTQRRALLKRGSLRWVEGPLLRQAAAVQFTTDAERNQAECLGIPMHSVVIPLAIEAPTVDRATTAPAPAQPYVAYLSRIDRVKNLESLLAAWSILQRSFPDWRLEIAGTGDAAYVAKLQAEAAAACGDAAVIWRGQLTGADKSCFLSGASIYVLPSHSENYGMAAAEALQAGKACLFTPGVAIGVQAAAQGAAMLAEGSPDALAHALRGLMQDADLRSQLETQAVRFAAAEFGTEIMGRRLKDLYASIVG